MTIMTRARGPISQDDGDLYSYFNKSVSAVQAHADIFEQEYARPALKSSQEFFDERPIAATFIAIFTMLSFIPVVSFIGCSAFAIVSFTTIALICAFLASVSVVLAFLSILVLFMLAILCSSIFLTLFAISVYSFVRFVILVRTHGRAGLSEWITETQHQVFSTLPLASPKAEIKDMDASDHEDTCGLSDVIKHEELAQISIEGTHENIYCDEDSKVVN